MEAVSGSNTFSRAAILRQSFLFESCDGEFLESLASHCRLVNLKKGQVLFREGEKSTAFYILLKGLVHLKLKLKGNEDRTIRFVHPGESFAEPVLFTEGGYPATAMASMPSVVMEIPKLEVLQTLAGSWPVTQAILRSLSMRLKEHISRMKLWAEPNIRIRFALFLEERLSESRTTEGEWFVVDSIMRKDVASYIAVAPETLSRLVRVFQQKGIIKMEAGKIRAINSKKLEEYFVEASNAPSDAEQEETQSALRSS